MKSLLNILADPYIALCRALIKPVWWKIIIAFSSFVGVVFCLVVAFIGMIDPDASVWLCAWLLAIPALVGLYQWGDSR